jgi:hypothetical protein
MTGPQDPAAAGSDQFRAGHADRELVIEALKVAFEHGRLTKDEPDTRAGQALTARTRADLAALTADIPPAPAGLSFPAAARPERPPAPARRRPLARAAAKSGLCLVIAAAAAWLAGLADPGGPGPNPYHSWAPLCLLVALYAVLGALGFLGYGVAAAVGQRHSRRQLPPRPGPGGHALEAEQSSGTGHGPALPPRPPRSDPR